MVVEDLNLHKEFAVFDSQKYVYQKLNQVANLYCFFKRDSQIIFVFDNLEM